MVPGPGSSLECSAAGVQAARRIMPTQRTQPGNRAPCYRPGQLGPMVISCCCPPLSAVVDTVMAVHTLS